MRGKDAKATAALERMAKASGTDIAGFNSQLATTKMFWTPAEACAVTTSPNLVKTMDLVRKFSFDHGLLGEGAKTVDAVGIEFPGGKTLGNAKNIKMRFDATYTKHGGRTASSERTLDCADALGLDQPAPGTRRRWLALGVLPFSRLLRACTLIGSNAAAGAKIPTTSCCRRSATLADTFHSYAFEEDERSGEVLLWVDTWASLKRIGSRWRSAPRSAWCSALASA